MNQITPALEIGGTHVSGGLVDMTTHRVLPASRRRLPLDATAGADSIVGQILDCAAAIPADPDQVWGVAVPGPFDYARGTALFRGVGKFDALYGLELGRILRDRLATRPSAVSFINDANAFLLGEWIAGAATGHERAVGITLGSGIGSAFLDRGALVEDDPRVPPEGRMDLLTYSERPLEMTVSRQAIRTHYRRLHGPERPDVTVDVQDRPDLTVDVQDRPDLTIDVRDIAQRARDGDATARHVIDHAFTALGQALTPSLRAFAPTVLVVGGAMSRSWDLIGDSLRAGIARANPPLPAAPDIVTASRPDDASLLGAAWKAHRETP